MKKPRLIILLLASVLLTPEVFAQSEHKSSNVENSSIAPTLPDGKNFSFGEEYNAKEDSFIFGIIGDRTGGNPIIGWPYFEDAIRAMNVLHRKMYGYLPKKIGYAVSFIESLDDRLVFFKFEANDYG